MDPQKYVLKLNEITEFIADLSHKPDRDLAIVSVALLDELINDVIQSKVTVTRGTNPPISIRDVFPMMDGKQLSLLKELGFINGDWHGEMKNLRTIRHLFAHTFKEITFEDEQISSKIKSLQIKNEDVFIKYFMPCYPDTAIKPRKSETEGFFILDEEAGIIFSATFSGNPETPKGRFLNSISACYSLLAGILLDVVPQIAPSSQHTLSER